MMNKKTMMLMMVAFSSVAVPVTAQEQSVRLVVSSYQSASQSVYSGAEDKSCVMSPGVETKWCVPGRVAKRNGTAMQKSVAARVLRTEVVELDSYGYDAEVVAQTLRDTGQFDEVVIDVPIKQTYSFTTSGDTVAQQDKYFGSNEDYASGSGVYNAAQTIGEVSGEALDVLVMDSSFYDTDDVVYYPDSGRSFVTGDDAVPDDNYSPRSTDGCDGHGLSVAGIIGGTIGNDEGGDGVSNSVNIHPIRVLTCGTGYMSDLSRALSWANGDSENLFTGDTSNATPYQGNVGIINISIAGYTGSAESTDDDTAGCPVYMQEAIDNLKASGWSIVVSAGNDYGDDVSNYSPANCDGVLSVVAVDSSGDKAEFSNQGDVSLAAYGTNLVTSCDEDSSEACLFSGTSASAPLVTGIMAMVEQHTGVSGETLDYLVKATAFDANFGVECNTYGCGNGIVDAEALLDAAVKFAAGELNTISFALNEGDECEQQWYLDYFGDAVRLCEMYSVKFLGGFAQDDAVYRLFSVPQDEDLSDSSYQTLVGEFEGGHVMLQDLDIEGLNYGMQICIDDDCSEVFEMNTANASLENKPVDCQ
ncbi:S8 family peptidase [Alteromonas sp. 14N.309.X.WAT.G.H12]|uniref:S8 family peptidase n=1 Tax=Alteromonas sp. 14N.309.X.WAT.G.H12 TaxID=3120824 RepID=UPI002FCEEE13